MVDRGIQGPLSKVLVAGVVATIAAIVIYYLVVGISTPSVQSSSVQYTLNNADQLKGKNITVRGYYENGVITDFQTNTTYQINRWDPSVVFLPVNTTNLPHSVFINRSYYFTGRLEAINTTPVYPLSTVLLNVTLVRPV
jgi:hypothetical protein